jgi:hypothetical protein
MDVCFGFDGGSLALRTDFADGLGILSAFSSHICLFGPGVYNKRGSDTFHACLLRERSPCLRRVSSYLHTSPLHRDSLDAAEYGYTLPSHASGCDPTPLTTDYRLVVQCH